MLLDIFDPKAPPAPIGIDLGTTHSIVGTVRDGQPIALVNCDGSQLLPSVVHYGEHGEVLVGAAAQSFAERAPTRTIASVKRFMGLGAKDPQTQALGAYQLVEPTTPEQHKVVRFDVGEQVVTPVEVSAQILASLGRSAKDQLNAIGGAVITVPAYFDDAQRQATKDAGRLAGLEVLRLLNEPTAAALAYGLQTKRDGTFAVFDLGGGTFDVTLLLLEDGVFQVRSTGGDSALGGDDMDRLLAAPMLEQMGFEPKDAPKEVIGLVLGAARQIKHRLTDDEVAKIELPRRGGGEVLFEMTREGFNAMIEPLLQRSGKACKRALRDAELKATELDGVILVGGATRVPAVRAYVAQLFGQEPLADIDPDLVVALGAAEQAQLLASQSEDVLLLDVLPLSLGVETMGGAVDKILPRNTTIPTGAKASFTTYADNQTGFDLHIVQGERELADDCRSLARFKLKGIPPMPAGLAKLEVHFNVDENGLLKVLAQELTTGIEQTIEVKPSYGLDDEQVEQMLMDALDYGEQDFEQRRLVEARVEGQRLLLATRNSLQTDQLERQRTGGSVVLSEEQEKPIITELAELERLLEVAKRPATLRAAIERLEHVTHDWAGRRMDVAIQSALTGKDVVGVAEEVAAARGVDAHVEEHQAGRTEVDVAGTVAPIQDPTTGQE